MLEYNNGQVPRFVTADIIYSECERVKVIVHAAVGRHENISQRERTAEHRRLVSYPRSVVLVWKPGSTNKDGILKNSYLN